MAKLKYDRPIVVAVDSSSVINVPNDEVWKVSVYHNGSSPYRAPESLDADGSTRIQIIGGGGNSKERRMPPASPSSTSTSKRTHGGDSPWLENLFSIGRFGSKQNKHRELWYRKTSCGKLVTCPAITLGFMYWSRIFNLPTLGIELLPGARRSKCGKGRHSAASLLKSWRNNAVEGVTLYA